MVDMKTNKTYGLGTMQNRPLIVSKTSDYDVISVKYGNGQQCEDNKARLYSATLVSRTKIILK